LCGLESSVKPFNISKQTKKLYSVGCDTMRHFRQFCWLVAAAIKRCRNAEKSLSNHVYVDLSGIYILRNRQISCIDVDVIQ